MMKNPNKCPCHAELVSASTHGILKQVQDDKNAFTLAEMMVVIAIVLILATAAITGSSGIIKNLRFGNAFNKIVFMVQSARSLAITGKNQNNSSSALTAYQIRFNVNPPAGEPQSVTLLATFSDGAEQQIENFQIETTTGLQFFADELVSSPTATPCISGTDPAPAIISFAQNTSKLTLRCNSTDQSLMQFGLRDTTTGTERKFIIHQAAGIPQIQ